MSCDKEKDQLNVSECALQMKQFYEEELVCTAAGSMEVNLYSGVYEGETLYFPMIMCPSCNTIPPSFGYTCDKTKVSIDDFATNVSHLKQVYNSCSGQFTE